MFLFDVTPAHAPLLIAAMRAVALADGPETPKERELLSAAHAALGLTTTLDDVTAADANDPALRELSPVEREHVVQSMLLMAIMDGAGTTAEAELVKRFADALSVTEPRVHNLRQLASGRLERMKLDLTRKGYAKTELLKTAHEEGLRGLYMTFAPLVGLGHDADIAKKYIALGELPEGTLGRGYFELITKNDLAFPGEGPIGERGVWHDMIHVIGGYPTDPRGEAEVVAFMAGFRREDPFFWVFTSVLQFQVGLRISPFAPGVPDVIEPRSYMAHHARGAKVNCDLSVDWRFQDDFATPLVELRRRFNVLPV